MDGVKGLSDEQIMDMEQAVAALDKLSANMGVQLLQQPSIIKELSGHLDKQDSITTGENVNAEKEKQKQKVVKDMFRAVSLGSLDALQDVLGQCQHEGVSVDEPVKDGITALHIAARQGDVKMAQLLLDKKADVNLTARGHDELTPLMFAASWGHIKVVEMLMDARADVNLCSSHGDTALMFAASGNHPTIVRKLLDAKARVNHQAQGTETALLMASAKGNTEVLGGLIDNNADVNLKCTGGVSALHFAARKGFRECATRLLDANADVDCQQEDNGWTPLMEAAHQGHLDFAKMMVLGGADTATKSKSGRTALMLARLAGKDDVAKYLATVTPLENNGVCKPGQCAVM